AMITVAAVLATSGNNMGQALSGSRNLFALAEQGDLPGFFGRVHPEYRTPANAVLVTAGVALVLALSGSFQSLAAASAISRLIVYVATCASTLRLRAPRFQATVKPAAFVIPLGPLVPLAAIAIALVILVGATPMQWVAGTTAFAAGALLYLVAVRRASPTTAAVTRG
ncbi:MAG: amino acid permease, partial [Acidobacteriota bacterium]